VSVYEHSRHRYLGHQGTRLIESFDFDEQPPVRQRLDNDIQSQQPDQGLTFEHEQQTYSFERPRLRQRTRREEPTSLVTTLI
jgi:hypothetical protein